MHCVAGKDDEGCVTGNDEGAGGAETGRAFLIDSEIFSMSGNSITVAYDSSEWDSWQDFKFAVEDYWDIHSPSNRVCDFESGCALSTQSQTADRIVFKIHH